MSEIAFAKGTPVRSVDECGFLNGVPKGTNGTVKEDAKYGSKVTVTFAGHGEQSVYPQQIVKN